MSPFTKLQRIYLVGLSGSGKTTCGKLLGEVMGCEFQDLDARIEERQGLSIPEIFQEQGESYFRAEEGRHLQETLSLTKTLIACGGGIVTRERNRQLLQKEFVVWLEVAPAEAAARLQDARDRPLLDRSDDALVENLNNQLLTRQALYQEVADLRIPTGGLAPEVVASIVLSTVKEHLYLV